MTVDNKYFKPDNEILDELGKGQYFMILDLEWISPNRDGKK